MTFVAGETFSLIGRLREHAGRRGDAVAYREISSGRELSYGQLWQRAESLAGRLTRGQVVMIRCPNTIEFPIAFLGTLIAGCVAFPVPPEITDTELSRAADISGANFLIGADAARDTGFQPVPGTPPARAGSPCHEGLYLQSSGTTGLPKIAYRSMASIDAVAEQMCGAIGIREGDHVLATIPLCHSYGLEHGLLAPVAAGATVCLAPFNTDVILRELASGSVMIFPGVPSVFEMLAQLHPPSEMRFSSLHAAYSAGAPLPRAVFDAFENAFGVRVAQLYGATEVGSVTYNDPAQADFDPASVGRGMRGVEIRICRIDDASAPLPAGEEGQVCIRAESMFDGYVDESETALIDGFFPTADLGHMDARGNLTITGRLKLLIDIGGLKVNPMEVEQVIQQHPSVAACVVVPIRQSQTVFRLKAIVTPRDAGHPPDADELRRFARERLTSYKVPRLIEVRPALPRSATGKVLRHQVEAS